MSGPFHQRPRPQQNEDWMLTYADCITLLLAFFVMMYTVSEVNLSKFEKIKLQIHSEFGAPGETHGIADSPEAEESTDDRANIPDPEVTPEESLFDAMEGALQDLAERGEVVLNATPDGVELEFNSSALYDTGRAEIDEHTLDTLAGRDGHHRKIDLLTRRIAVAFHELLVLVIHVLDAHLVERTVAHAHAEQRTWVIGVRVHPYRAVVADDHRRSGQRHHTLAHGVHVHRFALDDELGAVPVHLLLGVLEELLADARPVHGARRGRRYHQVGFRALQKRERTRHERDHALAASVHHARLLEDGKLLRRVGQRTLRGGERFTKHLSRRAN